MRENEKERKRGVKTGQKRKRRTKREKKTKGQKINLNVYTLERAFQQQPHTSEQAVFTFFLVKF
jgi:hypothetical protein